MLQTIIIDQIKEALDQFNRVCFIKKIYKGNNLLFKGQKYLYNTLTTTIKENQTNVNKTKFFF